MWSRRARRGRQLLVSGALAAALATALIPAGSAAAAGIDGWTQTGALTNPNGGQPSVVQLVEHESVVDDAGTAYALGGGVLYPGWDFGHTNYSVLRSLTWAFDDHYINLTLHPRDIHAFNYGGYLWFLGRDRDSTTFGLCLFRAPVPYTEMQRIGCVQPYRSGYDVVLANGYLYIVGGSGTSQVQYTKLNSSGTVQPWRTTTGPPLPNYGYSVAVEGRIYAFGVGNVIGSADQRRVQSAPINADGTLGAWREEANQPPAKGRAVAIGRDIYIVGPQDMSGLTYYSTAGVNGALGPWQTSTQVLPVTSQHSVTTRGNKIIVIGGLRPGTGTPNERASNAVLETTTSSQLSNLELLARYKPELRYDLLETYRADNAAMITDNCVLDSQNRIVRQNYVNDSRARHLAASCPTDKAADLSLTWLGSTLGATTDRIDEANNYAEDAQRMHGQGDYPNRAYGRVVPNTPDGGLILQYWFFHYYNPKTYYTVGAHEGDWEMVQVHLGPDRQPAYATYAQHGWGERCPWAQVETTSSGRPVVYVAEGSHASYFTAGTHHNPDPGNPLKLADDTADGGADWTVPVVQDITTAPSWLAWRGRWGGSDGLGASPEGPAFQGLKWTEPDAWSFGVKDCYEGETASAAAARRGNSNGSRWLVAPPRPRVTATREGRSVVIRYRFGHMGHGKRQRPYLLLAGVDARGDAYPPLTIRTRIKRAAGVIRQPLGLAEGRRRVLVGVLSKTGTRSQTFSVPIR